MNNKYDNPFFIVGCGRSGTTLLRILLNKGPTIGIPLESLFIADYVDAPEKLEIIKNLSTHEYEIEEWGIVILPRDVCELNSIKDVISRLHEIYIRKQGKNRWGQKTPRLVRHWRELAKMYPASQFIHIVRDPRAVVNSLIQSKAHNSTTYHGIKRWLLDVSFGVDMENTLGEERALRVYYENLVASPEGELKRICYFLGEPYDEEMLDASNNALMEYSRYYGQTHKMLASKPDPSRAKAWELDLRAWQINLIQASGAGLMIELGYAPKSIGPTKYLRFYEYCSRLARAYKLPKQFWQYFLHRRRYLTTIISRKFKLGLIGRTFRINI